MHRCNTSIPSEAAAPCEVYAEGWSRTIVSRPVAIALSVVFCAGLLAVPVADGFSGAWRDPARKAKEGVSEVFAALASGGWAASSLVDANNAALQTITSFESSLEDSSKLAAAIRPFSLDALLLLGGAGSEEAYMGRDGWVFYRPDVDAVVMRPSSTCSTAQGVANFAAQLAAQDIRLVVVPIPGKATIHPEKLSAGNVVFENPVASPIVADLADQVGEAWKKEKASDDTLAPILLDATGQMWRQKVETGDDQFLETDSHWTPRAMSAIAARVAKEIIAAGISVPPEELVSETKEISAIGDTALMLELPEASPMRTPQTVTVEQIKTADGNPWGQNRESPVLVLGDSYSNIYSADGLGWGGGAGFSEHLSLHLGSRVDKLARNDAGAKSAREMFVSEAVRNPGWLEGKKVVVWVMAAREFVSGDWSPVDFQMKRSIAGKKELFVVAPGEMAEVTARVLSLGALPVSGESPYADYLTALHLGEMEDANSGRSISGEALAYMFTMRDRKLLPTPGLAEGQRVKLRLSNYAEKADKLDALNRGELEDFGVMMEEPNFAEWIAPH